MTNEILYYGGIIITVAFGILSIVLFFKLHIYAVIGELTGVTAKKGIKRLKDEGNTGVKKKGFAIRNNTSKILVRRSRNSSKLNRSQKLEEETTVLRKEEGETTVLQQKEEETTVLAFGQQIQFELEKDIVVTHSDETIS